VAQDQRVFVGAARDLLHGNVACRARLVVHKNALPDGFAQFPGHGSCHDF